MKQANIKNSKTSSEWHCGRSCNAMGDNYGTALKNKVGKMRSDSIGVIPVSKKGMNTPPKSLA